MAHIVTNRGLHHMSTNDMSAADIRVAVFVGAAPAAATVRDYNFLSDLTAAQTEAAVTNYARQDLTGVSVTESDASDNVVITANDPTIDPGPAAGETWTTMAYYIFNASDAAAVLLSVDEIATSVPTNGGAMTLPAPSYTIAQA